MNLSLTVNFEIFFVRYFFKYLLTVKFEIFFVRYFFKYLLTVKFKFFSHFLLVKTLIINIPIQSFKEHSTDSIKTKGNATSNWIITYNKVLIAFNGELINSYYVVHSIETAFSTTFVIVVVHYMLHIIF